ncbi:MAG: hypothetical protein NWE89_04225 [Candidatus Bathyarchaeota archaeon]|nr:hypothetical protein [Candidatus Bathyarchaeota archaeon]
MRVQTTLEKLDVTCGGCGEVFRILDESSAKWKPHNVCFEDGLIKTTIMVKHVCGAVHFVEFSGTKTKVVYKTD